MEHLVDMYPLKLPPLTLTQISSIKIATHVWRQPDIKNQVKELFLMKRGNSLPTVSEGQKSIFNSVFKKIDNVVELPVTQASDLKFVAMQLGINMFQWLAEIWDYNKEDFIDSLQWDRTGCIDAAETYRSVYLSGKITQATPTRMVALHKYCLEDCIDGYWCKIPHKKRASKFQKFRFCFPEKIFLYWTDYINALPEDNAAKKYREVEGKLLSLRSEAGLPYQSLKYFWNKSTELRKGVVVRDLEHFWAFDFNRDGLAVSIDCLNDLVDLMTDTEDPEFRQKNVKELEKFVTDVLLHWPWQDLFLTMIKKPLDSIKPKVYYHTLNKINQQSYMEYQILGSTRRYHNITMGLWRITPKHVKLAMNTQTDFAWHVLDILKVNDMELLREIFGDEDLSEVRRDLLDPNRGHWCYQVREIIDEQIDGNPAIFENFVQHVLQSDEEREWFRTTFYSPHLISVYNQIHQTTKHNEAVLRSVA